MLFGLKIDWTKQNMRPVEFSICMPHLMGLVLGGYMLQSYYIRCWSLIAEWDIAANGSKWYSVPLRKCKAGEKKIKNLALKKTLLGFSVEIILILTTTALSTVNCHSRIRLTSYSCMTDAVLAVTSPQQPTIKC